MTNQGSQPVAPRGSVGDNGERPVVGGGTVGRTSALSREACPVTAEYSIESWVGFRNPIVPLAGYPGPDG